MSASIDAGASLASVFHALAERRRHGVLEIDAADGSLQFGFVDGQIAWFTEWPGHQRPTTSESAPAATSARLARLRLEQVMASIGTEVAAEYRSLNARALRLDESLRALADGGWVQLHAAGQLHQQVVTELVLELLPRVGLLVRFREEPASASQPPLPAVPVAPVLDEADRRHRDRLTVERRLPSPDRIVWPSLAPPQWKALQPGQAPSPPGAITPASALRPEGPQALSLLERWMLARAVDRPSAGRLVDEAPFGTAVASRALARLLHAGLIGAQSEEDQRPNPRTDYASPTAWRLVLVAWAVLIGAATVASRMEASGPRPISGAWSSMEAASTFAEDAVESHHRLHLESAPIAVDALWQDPWMPQTHPERGPVGLEFRPDAPWGERVALPVSTASEPPGAAFE